MKKKNMGHVIIDWSSVIPYSRINKSSDDYLNYPGFYMILSGMFDKKLKKYVYRKLQYIGQAYYQNIRERLLQDHAAYDKISRFLLKNPEHKLLIQAGIIIESSYEKETAPLFNDIEALLIFDNQPWANTLHKDSDNTKRNITVINEWMNELIKEVSYRYS